MDLTGSGMGAEVSLSGVVKAGFLLLSRHSLVFSVQQARLWGEADAMAHVSVSLGETRAVGPFCELKTVCSSLPIVEKSENSLHNFPSTS